MPTGEELVPLVSSVWLRLWQGHRKATRRRQRGQKPSDGVTTSVEQV